MPCHAALGAWPPAASAHPISPLSSSTTLPAPRAPPSHTPPLAQGDNKGFLVCKKKMATSPDMLSRYSPPPFKLFAEAVVNLKFDEVPKYGAYMALFEPLCGPPGPGRPIITDSAPAVSATCCAVPCCAVLPMAAHTDGTAWMGLPCLWRGASMHAMPCAGAAPVPKRRLPQPRPGGAARG